MKVYIEYVALDNFIFDWLLLDLSLRGKGVERNGFRIFLAAITGTLVAVVMPLLKIHQLFLFAIKIALALVMVAEAGKFSGFKRYLMAVNMFLLCTFLFGGFIYGVMFLIGKDYSFLYSTTDSIVPLGFMIIVAIIVYKLLYKAYICIFEKKVIYPFVRKCLLMSGERSICVWGLIDSGNHLIYDGDKPVCVAGGQLVKKMFLSGFLNDREVGEITLATVNGQSSLKIYQIDKILIYNGDKVNIINQPQIGVGKKTCNMSDDYQLILSAYYGVENY